MDIITVILSIIILFLIIALFYFLSAKKSKLKEKFQETKTSTKLEEKDEEVIKTTLEVKEKLEEISQKLKTNEEITKLLLEGVDKRIENVNANVRGEIANQQKLFQEKNKELNEKFNKDLGLHLNSNQQLIKAHLENLNKGISQPLEKINSVLLHSGKRGAWGNTQLDQLLSLYLPKDNKIYQTEFQLKKKRTNNKEEGLRVDAIVFSVNGKNNIAIDSKFPLENYLSSANSDLTEEQKDQFEKKFENDVKKHVDKVAEYVSEEDGTKYAIMFVPSEVIFSKINEQRYYNIVEVALKKRVSICSPAILLVIIDQLLLWNKTWEQYKNLDKITFEISKFWDNLKLFKERWDKIIKTIDSNYEAIRKFNISTRKLIEDGEKIKNRESDLLEKLPKDLSESEDE